MEMIERILHQHDFTLVALNIDRNNATVSQPNMAEALDPLSVLRT